MPTRLIRYDDKTLYVSVPNVFFKDWLEEHNRVILEAGRLAGLGDVNVIYLIEETLEPGNSPSQGKLDFESVDNTLNPKYTFDRFFLYGPSGLGKTHLYAKNKIDDLRQQDPEFDQSTGRGCIPSH